MPRTMVNRTQKLIANTTNILGAQSPRCLRRVEGTGDKWHHFSPFTIFGNHHYLRGGFINDDELEINVGN